MIQISTPNLHTSSAKTSAIDEHDNAIGWQQHLAAAIRDPTELLNLLDLPGTLLPQAIMVSKQFPLRVPHPYLNRIRKGDQHDPLLRQVLPIAAESQQVPGFVSDPVGDLNAQTTPGLIHKYHGRVLLVVTGACAIHCRYCFRRHFPYSESNPLAANWELAQQTIAADPTINEVILSGGDPLSLSDERLAQIIQRLEQIPQLQTLRLHTRLPVVIPQRITTTLLNQLAQSRLKTVVVIHANHANELDNAVKSALMALHNNNITLLNQSVLLKGVNDTTHALKQLSETLFHSQVLPYYLHQLDKVQGAAHFELSDTKAKQLISNLRRQLPGYLVPKLVREQSGATSKQPLY